MFQNLYVYNNQNLDKKFKAHLIGIRSHPRVGMLVRIRLVSYGRRLESLNANQYFYINRIVEISKLSCKWGMILFLNLSKVFNIVIAYFKQKGYHLHEL